MFHYDYQSKLFWLIIHIGHKDGMRPLVIRNALFLRNPFLESDDLGSAGLGFNV